MIVPAGACCLWVALVLFGLLAARASAEDGAQLIWPPKVGEPYPDLRLIDQTGQRTALSSFRGKVVIVEAVGMSCPACQAFAGANRKGVGPFDGGTAQSDLQSFEEYVAKYGHGVTLAHPDVVYVQLLLFDPALRTPSAGAAHAWAHHFGMDRTKNQVVLAGESFLIDGPRYQQSYDMVPGFQLIDRDFILRIDATGHQPRHDLWKELFPALVHLLQ